MTIARGHVSYGTPPVIRENPPVKVGRELSLSGQIKKILYVACAIHKISFLWIFEK
jgi:hypothetical protein